MLSEEYEEESEYNDQTESQIQLQNEYNDVLGALKLHSTT